MSTATAPRDRHERQIKLLNSTFGREFDKALDRVVVRHRGLSFFTDDQIADIRDLMIQTAADKRRRAAESRAHYAAVQASQTKETA